MLIPSAMAKDIDPFKLSSPRIFLVRMLVFLILCALVMIVLYKQIWVAFLANPGLNALILAVLGMWLMAATMMGGVMGGCCGLWGGGGWLIGLLILAGIIATVVLFMRRAPRP